MYPCHLTRTLTSALFAGVIVLLGKAVSQRTKLEVVQKSLKTMMLLEQYAKDIVSSLREWRFDVETNVKTIMKGESLKGFRWRVDVTISTDSLGKVFKPCILGECKLLLCESLAATS